MIDDSLAIRKNIEVNNMLVVPAQEGAVTREVTEYVVRQDDLAKDYEDAFKDVLKLPGSKGEGEGVAQMIRAVQAGVKCTPYLFDEVSNKSFGQSIKKELINADFCERSGRQQQPVIVFTSNDMEDPKDVVRKRSIHLVFDAALRSDVDQNAFRNQGNRLKNRFTGALYGEFTRRVLPGICVMIDDIYSGEDKPDTWYPDVFALSSRVFLEILRDYGYDVPPYMRELEWNRDYSDARNAFGNTVSEIQELYALNPDIFKFVGGFVTISLGLDPGKQKLMKSWFNTLPPEAQADCHTSRDDGAVLRVNLRELERLGFRRKSWTPWDCRRRSWRSIASTSWRGTSWTTWSACCCRGTGCACPAWTISGSAGTVSPRGWAGSWRSNAPPSYARSRRPTSSGWT